MMNNIITQDEYLNLKSKYDKLNDITIRISGLLNDSINNFLKIGYLLFFIKENDLHELGFQNIYDYSKITFGLGTTSTKNFISVYKKFGTKVPEDYLYRYVDVKVKKEYQNYSMSQLVELLNVPEEEINNYSPELTINELRSLKKQSQMSDYEQKFLDDAVKFISNLLLDDGEYQVNFYSLLVLYGFKNNKYPKNIIFKNNEFKYIIKDENFKHSINFILNNTCDELKIKIDGDKSKWFYSNIIINDFNDYAKFFKDFEKMLKDLSTQYSLTKQEVEKKEKETKADKLLKVFQKNLKQGYYNNIDNLCSDEVHDLCKLDNKFKEYYNKLIILFSSSIILGKCPYTISEFYSYTGFEVYFTLNDNLKLKFDNYGLNFINLKNKRFNINEVLIKCNKHILKYKLELPDNYTALDIMILLACKYNESLT